MCKWWDVVEMLGDVWKLVFFRRVCRSAPKPGVTRDLRWNRLGTDLDLLDAPGAQFDKSSIASLDLEEAVCALSFLDACQACPRLEHLMEYFTIQQAFQLPET